MAFLRSSGFPIPYPPGGPLPIRKIPTDADDLPPLSAVGKLEKFLGLGRVLALRLSIERPTPDILPFRASLPRLFQIGKGK
jgi:hypothetical protein